MTEKARVVNNDGGTQNKTNNSRHSTDSVTAESKVSK